MSHVVPINWTELETAFERNAPDVESHLDLTTGEVLTLMDGQPDLGDRRARLSQSPGRFLRIEPASSREQYRWMERFVVTVGDESLRERLIIAIDGKGAFRRFKDVLLSYPAERERWFAYRSDLLHFRMQSWLQQMQIEPQDPPPWGEVSPPPEPTGPLPRPAGGVSESPGELLRRQTKDLVDSIPAMELPSAIAFLEFLRDRGCASLLAGREARREPEAAHALGEEEGADEAHLAGRTEDAEEAEGAPSLAAAGARATGDGALKA